MVMLTRRYSNKDILDCRIGRSDLLDRLELVLAKQRKDSFVILNGKLLWHGKPDIDHITGEPVFKFFHPTKGIEYIIFKDPRIIRPEDMIFHYNARHPRIEYNMSKLRNAYAMRFISREGGIYEKNLFAPGFFRLKNSSSGRLGLTGNFDSKFNCFTYNLRYIISESKAEYKIIDRLEGPRVITVKDVKFITKKPPRAPRKKVSRKRRRAR